ncbi:MAG: hypothetical protein D6754_17370, partial [Alphaproteobacteria bacterium]
AARFLPAGGLVRLRPGRDAAGEAAARLAGFVERATARIGPLLAGLSRRRDWRARAAAAARDMPGRSPARAVAVIAGETLVSANLLRDRLAITQQAANAVLRRLAAAGLIEELSGQSRYRLWRARL